MWRANGVFFDFDAIAAAAFSKSKDTEDWYANIWFYMPNDSGAAENVALVASGLGDFREFILSRGEGLLAGNFWIRSVEIAMVQTNGPHPEIRLRLLDSQTGRRIVFTEADIPLTEWDLIRSNLEKFVD